MFESAKMCPARRVRRGALPPEKPINWLPKAGGNPLPPAGSAQRVGGVQQLVWVVRVINIAKRRLGHA